MLTQNESAIYFKRKQVIVMSILMTIHPNDEKNDHFQALIDEWQQVYDKNERSCQMKMRRLDERGDIFKINTTEAFNDWNIEDVSQNATANRALKDTTPYGSGGWDPFHKSLERVSK